MIRTLTSLLLALVLALTSQSMAVARGSSAATGQMVLCTGAGPVAVYVDAQGKPTAAPHICPDAALNVLVELAASGPVVPHTLAWVAHQVAFDAAPQPRLPQQSPPARAPPLTV